MSEHRDEFKNDIQPGICAYEGCDNPLPEVKSTSHSPIVCDECGLLDEQEDLQRRFPPIDLGGLKEEPVEVDLAAEGNAIADVLVALNTLPPHSIQRVFNAVRGLIGADSGRPIVLTARSAYMNGIPVATDQAVLKNLNALAALQGTGEEDAP